MRREIARELARQTQSRGGERIEANSFGAGYVISTPRGKRILVETLDDAVRALTFPVAPSIEELQAGRSRSLVHVSVLLSRLCLHLKGSDVEHTITLEDALQVTVSARGVVLGTSGLAQIT